MGAKRSKAILKSPKNEREKLFVIEYLVDFNGAAAARRAGFSKNTARYTAYQLLTKPHIVQEINNQLQERAKKIEANADFTLGKLKALANSNIKHVAQWVGDSLVLRDSASLTADEAYSIESIQINQTLHGTQVKLKMREPHRALEMLGRHQGLFDIGDQDRSSEELTAALKQLDAEQAATAINPSKEGDE